MAQESIEIRWHGRGGQGTVTASKLLAEAALEEGKYFQALPDYGAERTGAPIRAYTRISSSPIVPHSQVTDPDLVMIMDSTLIGVVNVTEGLKNGGAVVANTTLSPAELRAQMGFEGGRVYTVDATGIALDTMGRNFPNTPMLGALLRAAQVVSKETLLREVRSKLASVVKAEVLEGNLKAFERAYQETKEG